MHSEITRPSLLERLRHASDHAAWREFDDKYRELILRFCRGCGLGLNDAEDVRQSVLIGMAERLQAFRYDAAVGRFRNYLGRAVRNAVIQLLRSRRGEPQHEPIDEQCARAADTDDLARQWEAEWRRHHLRLAMRKVRRMHEPASVVVFERLLGGESIADVAASSGLSEASVHKVKQRIRDRLAELVAAQIAEEDGSVATPHELGL